MSFDLLSNVQAIGDDVSQYHIPYEHNVPEASPLEIEDALNGIVGNLVNSPENISDESTWDTLRSFLKYSQHLDGHSLSKLIDSLVSSFQSELDATNRDLHPTDHAAYRTHRPCLEMHAFALNWLVQASGKSQLSVDQEEKQPVKKGRGKKAATSSKSQALDWAKSFPSILAVMAKALRLRVERIWTTTAERDTFVGCFMKPARYISESETYMKSQDIRLAIYKVVCLAVKNCGAAFTAQTIIMQHLQYFEHTSDYMAELIAVLLKEFDYPQLGEEILRDISTKVFAGVDTRGPRSYSRFLVKLAELAPRLVLKQISLLQKHLDSESYPMRNAIVEVLGLLITDLSKTGDPSSLEDTGEDDNRDHSYVQQIEGFFDLLFDRFLDVNTYVRSKVVSVVTKLLDLPIKFPSQRLRLVKEVTRNLEDKSSSVRKQCMSCISKLIATHPYGRIHGGELCLSDWKSRADQLEKELGPLEKKFSMDMDEEQENEKKEGEDEEKEKAEKDGKKKKKSSVKKEKGGMEVDDEEDEEEDEEPSGNEKDKDETMDDKKQEQTEKDLSSQNSKNTEEQQQLEENVDHDNLIKLRLTKRYYADALFFVNQIEKAMTTVSLLVASTIKSEVLEAMDLIKIAYEYKVESAQAGVKRMLHLIWSKDNSTVEDGKEIKSVRGRLIECYKELYFNPVTNLQPNEQVNRIARNLIALTMGATLAELTSLEQLLSLIESEEPFHDDIVNKLWQVYSTSKEIPKFQRTGAIIILGMLAISKPDIITDKIDVLLRVGLGQYAKTDLVLAKYTCIALRRVGGTQKKIKGSLTDQSVRLPMDNIVFEKLRQAIENPIRKKEWFTMAEQAISTIYTLGDQPDALCSDMLRNMTADLFGDQQGSVSPPATPSRTTAIHPGAQQEREGSTNNNEDVEMQDANSNTEDGQPQPTQTQRPAKLSNSFDLARAIFFAGHCAIKHLIHLELVEKDHKRRKAEANKNTKRKSATQEELEQVAGSVEDDIADFIQATKETELLYGQSAVLSIYSKLAVNIAANPKSYPDPILQRASVLALSKFMCVSAKFCDDHLLLLFKILETTSDPVIRSNIVIGLGDIAICFSTLMDENSDRLYAGLMDRDLTVKKNTLMVLTHLILNGMIKVKGQLGEMAKCLEDEEERISDLSKLFFTELATKDNAIYNNLPDMISHLSVGKHSVDEEAFARTMQFIFKFLDKERQAEAIVEKLCQRFRLVSDERHWRDIAFCVSLLPFRSERSFKKLVEGLPLYQDKLYEPTVFLRFQDILTKVKSGKVAKSESEIAEFESALAEYRSKGEEDQQVQKKVKKRVIKARGRGKDIRRTPPEEDSEEGEKDDVPASTTATASKSKKAPPKRQPTRRKAATRARKVVDESEDDDDDE